MGHVVSTSETIIRWYHLHGLINEACICTVIYMYVLAKVTWHYGIYLTLTVQYTNNFIFKDVKGSLTREFRLQVFFINQCPPGP
jgi:hypothetical protein